MIANMAVLAVFLKRNTFDQWSASHIDEVVYQGSKAYGNVIMNLANTPPSYLAHNEVPHFVDGMAGLFQVDVHGGLLYAVVGQNGSQTAMSVNLASALITGFEVSSSLLFTSGE